MATSSQTWKLKRYGRFVPGTKGKTPWKPEHTPGQCLPCGAGHGRHTQVFEANDKKPEIFLTIVQSGHLLVMQGQESLDTISLLCGADFLKAHQKSDNLMFRFTLKGESRMMRMQFDGRNRAEATKECSRAVGKLMEYSVSVSTQDDVTLPPHQTPAEVSAPVTQQTWQGKAAGDQPEVVQGSLSIKRLTQHLLGETAVTLPQIYRHTSQAHGDLEPMLRVCLLDPSFHAFVDEVEGELRKLLQE